MLKSAKRERGTKNLVVGVISDTHRRMHPNALEALRGSDIILHAGDIGSEEILHKLGSVAPVHAIVGNADIEPLASKYSPTDVIEVGEHTFYMLHNVRTLDVDPKAAGFSAVIFGHSHKPEFYFEKGVLFFNPGSAGPRRFSLPIAVGKICIENGELLPEIVILEE